MRVLRRSLAGLTCAAVLVGGSAIALADEPEPYRVQAVSAARWLAGELATAADVAAYDAANPTAKGGLVEGTLPGQIVDKPPPTDWGLTIDALLTLKATGADDAAANKIADRVAAHVGSFISDPAAPEKRVSGSIAKEIVAAVAGGRNSRDFGGFDLVAELTGLMVEDGDEKGRFKDRVAVPSEDRTNNFGQAYNTRPRRLLPRRVRAPRRRPLRHPAPPLRRPPTRERPRPARVTARRRPGTWPRPASRPAASRSAGSWWPGSAWSSSHVEGVRHEEASVHRLGRARDRADRFPGVRGRPGQGKARLLPGRHGSHRGRRLPGPRRRRDHPLRTRSAGQRPGQPVAPVPPPAEQNGEIPGQGGVPQAPPVNKPAAPPAQVPPPSPTPPSSSAPASSAVPPTSATTAATSDGVAGGVAPGGVTWTGGQASATDDAFPWGAVFGGAAILVLGGAGGYVAWRRKRAA